MIDQGEMDDKIIAVAKNDKSINHVNDISDLPDHILQQIHRFFSDYKKLEDKEVLVDKFEGRNEAFQIVKDAIKLYNEKFEEIQPPVRKPSK